MFSSKTSSKYRLDREKQGTVFTIFARLLSLILLIAGTFEFIPAWILRDPIDEVHLWHIAELTALSIPLLGCIAFAASYHPHTKPLLAQFLVLGTTSLSLGIMPFNIKGGIALFLVAILFVLTYPNRRTLLALHLKGTMSIPLLILTVLFALFLLPQAQREVYWQILGLVSGDPHSTFLHWIGSALLFVLLIQAGTLAATKQPGWKVLAVATAVTYCYLGFTAMITPFYAGSWGITAGLFAIFGGILYGLFTLVEAESMRLKQEATFATTIVDEQSYISDSASPSEFAFSATQKAEEQDEKVAVYR